MVAKPYVMTPSEVEILNRGAEDPNIITDYFFRAKGETRGWLFDDNFAPEGAWQKTVHHAEQTDIVLIGGFGTGKTLGVGMSASVWAATTPSFKFLNVAQKAWQAKQMYDHILLAAQGTPFERLIAEKPRRPFPKIIIRYVIEDFLVESSLEFMSADKNATGILSWEGDWINVDEAGLLDNLEDIITALGSRLRGSVRGRPRLGRMSLTSNSWDNAYLWYYFDMAQDDPENYLSIISATRHNNNVTQKQLDKMMARIPENERERWLNGARPEGKGSFFSKEHVYACEDHVLGAEIDEKTRTAVPGYGIERIKGAGAVYFRTPPKKDEHYVIMGDPGVGEAPKRNAPVIMVWGVPSAFPDERVVLRSFWWGNGHGAISPFVEMLLQYREEYSPIITGVDATGTQKNMAELINIQYLGMDSAFGDGGITAMDFSGGKKAWYLHALRMFVEANRLSWPNTVVGIRSQLTNYDIARDRKIPQDIIATMAMSAFAIRSYFYVELADLLPHKERGAIDDKIISSYRRARLAEDQRSRRSSR